jgi:hypothetical protein
MKININDTVKVRLTKLGRTIAAQERECIRSILARNGCVNLMLPERKPDAEGWTEWQLWDLMQVFGPRLYHGGDPPFETEIEIVEK